MTLPVKLIVGVLSVATEVYLKVTLHCKHQISTVTLHHTSNAHGHVPLHIPNLQSQHIAHIKYTVTLHHTLHTSSAHSHTPLHTSNPFNHAPPHTSNTQSHSTAHIKSTVMLHRTQQIHIHSTMHIKSTQPHSIAHIKSALQTYSQDLVSKSGNTDSTYCWLKKKKCFWKNRPQSPVHKLA